MFWIGSVWAQAAPGAQPSTLEVFAPIIFFFILMFFFFIRPQMKKQKQHQDFITNLKRGDAVVTNAGMLGTIEGLTDTVVTLKLADNVKIKILKSAILGGQNFTGEKK